jgi:hypothetical protein
MYSGRDTPKGWVSPFGHPRINDRSHLPAAFRSVPRPSSPLGAKASTECPSLTPYPHHRPRTGPKHAPCCLQSRTAAPAIPPRTRSNSPRTMCRNHSHTRSSSPCERTCSPQHATRLPLEDPGPHRQNGFRKCRHLIEVAHPACHRLTPKDAIERHRQRDAAPRRSATRIASLPLRGISFCRSAAKGNGDGRIRTDDPLLAKQVLSH